MIKLKNKYIVMSILDWFCKTFDTDFGEIIEYGPGEVEDIKATSNR